MEKCAINQYLDNNTGTCHSCDPSCVTCTANSPSACTGCNIDDNKTLTAGVCVTCNTNTHIFDAEKNTCTPKTTCSNSILNCQNGCNKYGQCEICDSGSSEYEMGLCLKPLPNKFYDFVGDVTQIESCDISCSTCFDENKDSCITCPEG
jgi:hypothetical protein